MYSKFSQLDPEKQARVINAAIKVFAQKRYKEAGTDDIVKEAGISKGSLFHYFRNKKDLYQFMFNYSTNILMKEFFGAVDLSEKDFLKRWMHVIEIKLLLLKKHPDMFNFIKNAYIEEDEELKTFFGAKEKEIIAESYSKLLKDIDITLFREDININQAINVIMWTLESYSQKHQAELGFDHIDAQYFERVISELESYMDLFKKCFYKEE